MTVRTTVPARCRHPVCDRRVVSRWDTPTQLEECLVEWCAACGAIKILIGLPSRRGKWERPENAARVPNE